MPAMVGVVNVNSMGGIFNIGDAQTISPTQFLRIFAGSGSFNAAEKMEVKNESSVINVYDSSVFDQNLVSVL